MYVHELSTPAVIIDAAALAANIVTMAAARPGPRLRPHVKAHKCTSLARRQAAAGHQRFTCATAKETYGIVSAGVSTDVLLANEVLDPARLEALAGLDDAMVTIAVDSSETIRAASAAGLRSCVIDVNVGLPRCGCDASDAGRLADEATAARLDVRGVMGYEGHLMALTDREAQQMQVLEAMQRLLAAHEATGGEVVSAGGTGTYDLHDHTGVTEVQAGSYALMDTAYAELDLPFDQAMWVVGTVVSVHADYAVADVGLKSLGMDHGNPSITGGRVWFCSDEHVTFSTDHDADQPLHPSVGARIRVTPAHIDPTMAAHDLAWVVQGDEVVDRWPIDLRGW